MFISFLIHMKLSQFFPFSFVITKLHALELGAFILLFYSFAGMGGSFLPIQSFISYVSQNNYGSCELTYSMFIKTSFIHLSLVVIFHFFIPKDNKYLSIVLDMFFSTINTIWFFESECRYWKLRKCNMN